MAAIGERNALRVVRETKSGAYLDGGPLGEILLPGRQLPRGTVPGDYLEVFVHHDSEDRVIATTQIPHACVGDFAALKVIGLHPRAGAFLEWGLSKDLLLPVREQAHRVAVGEIVVVFVFIDRRSGRIVATTRLDRHFSQDPPSYEVGEKASVLVAGETPLGYKVVVANAHAGLLYKTDLAGPLTVGETRDAFVRAVRPDGKIDLALDPAGYERVAPLAERILAALRDAPDQRLALGDHSAPEVIREQFSTSKKAFKQALGALLRERRIRLTEQGVELVPPSSRTA